MSEFREMMWELRWGFYGSVILAILLLSTGASCVKLQ